MSEAPGRPVGERLMLCHELMSWRYQVARISEASPIKAKVLAGRRIAAIRALLLGGASGDLTQELLNLFRQID